MSELNAKEVFSVVFFSVLAFFFVVAALAIWGLFFFLSAWGFGSVLFVAAGIPPLLLGLLSGWAAIVTVRNSRR
jgi:hypothetical protein